MPAMTIELNRLTCPSCGAGAAVDTKVPYYTCAFCGQAARVTKAKGTVVLSKLEDIANNTSAAADEMALKRLNSELQIVGDRRRKLETELEAAVAQPIAWLGSDHHIIFGKYRYINEPLIIGGGLVVGLFYWALSSFMAFVVTNALCLTFALFYRSERIRSATWHNESVDGRRANLTQQIQHTRAQESTIREQRQAALTRLGSVLA